MPFPYTEATGNCTGRSYKMSLQNTRTQIQTGAYGIHKSAALLQPESSLRESAVTDAQVRPKTSALPLHYQKNNLSLLS